MSCYIEELKKKSSERKGLCEFRVNNNIEITCLKERTSTSGNSAYDRIARKFSVLARRGIAVSRSFLLLFLLLSLRYSVHKQCQSGGLLFPLPITLVPDRRCLYVDCPVGTEPEPTAERLSGIHSVLLVLHPPDVVLGPSGEFGVLYPDERLILCVRGEQLPLELLLPQLLLCPLLSLLRRLADKVC